MGKDRDLEVVELDEDAEAFSIGRLLAVAAVGALTSLGAYYMYQQLDEEKRTSIRRKASGMVADQFQRLTEVDE